MLWYYCFEQQRCRFQTLLGQCLVLVALWGNMKTADVTTMRHSCVVVKSTKNGKKNVQLVFLHAMHRN